jgi:hypothetical protein
MAPPTTSTDPEWTILSDTDALSAAMCALDAVARSSLPL